MNRTTLLQDRGMEKFEELLKRWHDGELSGAEAGEFLGCSERQFRPRQAVGLQLGQDQAAGRQPGAAAAPARHPASTQARAQAV